MPMSDQNETLLYAVGGVAPSRPDPGSLFAKTGGELRRADVAFCQYLGVDHGRGRAERQADRFGQRIDG